MRALFLLSFITLALSSPAQYYYKDIINTKESSDLIKTYLKNNVSRVVLSSFDADDTKSDNLFVQQQFFPGTRMLKIDAPTGRPIPRPRGAG